MISLNEYRAKKEGKVTPNKLAESLMKFVEENECELMVCVIKTKAGDIDTTFSHGLRSEHIGLLEIGKMQIIDEMRE
ncbi:hypothetical protein [Siminovitchia sp. FSL W7-1587]|uniref:hypothetical protein n=1 Tax=Siminovitchia sp. FSL W7-1587 TaxID=2954699 RepID=UPI0030CE8D2E